jgi:hypothetical protein
VSSHIALPCASRATNGLGRVKNTGDAYVRRRLIVPVAEVDVLHRPQDVVAVGDVEDDRAGFASLRRTRSPAR